MYLCPSKKASEKLFDKEILTFEIITFKNNLTYT